MKMENNNNVCRICLKIPDANITLINEVTKKRLEVLLIKMDLAVSEDPMICRMCSGILDDIYMFKSKCLYSEDIVSAHFEGNLKVNLRDILKEFKNKPNAHTVKDTAVCRLCLKIPPNGNYISLSKSSDKVSDCRNIVRNQLPEINLSLSEQPIICEACHALLINYSSFATNCMDVEHKIKMYYEPQKIDVKEQLDLMLVQQFTENKALDCENSFIGDFVIKQEDSSVHVKVEKIDVVEKENISEDHYTNGSRAEFYIKQEEVEIKSEDNLTSMELEPADQLVDHVLSRKNGSSKELLNSSVQSNEKNHLCPRCLYFKRQHLPVRVMGFDSDKETCNCSLCPMLTITGLSQEEVPSHKGSTKPFGCCECSYETEERCHLRRHFITHQSKLETEIYKCDKCKFESKHKQNLIRHLKIHEDPSAVQKFKCEECSFETTRGYNLKKHMARHVDLQYSCDQCSYSTHVNKYLLGHKYRNHTSPKVILRCDQCNFHARHRRSLWLHKKTHDPSKHQLKCKQCEYSTYLPTRLSKHLLSHMELEETTVFSCATCDYRSKYKSNLGSHMKSCLKKKNGGDTGSRVQFQCDRSNFHTNNKRSFYSHNKRQDSTKHKL